MKRIPRSEYHHGFFHVMVQGINKKFIFEKSIEKEEYLSLLLKYKENFKIILLAYCIMDNHVHLLIYTDEVYEMSEYMRIVNSKFARDYNKAFDRVGYVFRDRFNSQYIDTKDYLQKCLNYIHMNPVKANIVKKPSEYKYSTYNDYMEKKGIVNDRVIEKIFNEKEDYKEKFANIPNDEIEVMDIDREQENFMVAVKKYIKKRKVELENVKNKRELFNEFCEYLVIEKKYKQVQVAKLLECDIKKIYYTIKKAKEAKNSPAKRRKKIEKDENLC